MDPRLVDVGEATHVQLAESDPREWSGRSVSIPDRAWPEFSEAPPAQCTKCCILGPLRRDTSSYAVEAAGFAYVFSVEELKRFLPHARPSPGSSRRRADAQHKRVRRLAL